MSQSLFPNEFPDFTTTALRVIMGYKGGKGYN